MPQIPTFSNLPDVAPVRPEVTPQQGVDRFQRADLEAPGEGMQALGRGIDTTADDAAKIANNMAVQQNEVAAKNAATQHQGYVNNLAFSSLDGQGGPAFYAMKGQDAVNALPQFIQAMTAQRDQGAQGLTNQAKTAYTIQTDTDIARETETAQRYAMVQGQDAATQASTARIDSAINTSTLNYTNPDTIAAQDNVIRGETADEARRKGFAPNSPEANLLTQTALSKSHLQVVEAAVAKGDINTAASAINTYGPGMVGADFVRATELTKAPLLKLHSQSLGNQLLGGQPPGQPGVPTSMDAPYQQGAGYYDAVHGGEGNGVNTTTGASGPVQVMGGTAAAFHASPEGQGVDVNTEAGARQFTKWYGDQNATQISEVTGQPATVGQVVAAHLLGPGGAKAIIANPDDPIGKHLTTGAISNNLGPLPGGASMTGREAQVSIANYYSKAAGNQFAGPGAPTAASVAAQKPPRPDFEGAIAAIPARTNGDVALEQATDSYLRSQMAMYDLGEKTEREGIIKGGPGKPSFADTLTALQNGNTDMQIPELAYRRAFPPAIADGMMKQVQDAQAEGQITKGLQFATPDQMQTQRAALEAKLSPTAPVEGQADAAKRLTLFNAATNRNAENLKHDPFSYVASHPTVAAAFAANTANPTPQNLAAAVAASEAVQAQLGATPQAISTQGIAQNVAAIHSAKPEDVPGMMRGLSQQYGAAWPDVFRDLTAQGPGKGNLNPDYRTLGTMPQSGAGIVDYAAALAAKNTKGDKFGEAMVAANVGAKTNLETAINDKMKPLQDSFQGSSGDGVIEGYRNSVRTLATFYGDRGVDPATAVKNAYDAVFSNLSVKGGIRAPTSLNGQPFSASTVQQAGDAYTSNLKETDLQHGADGKPVATLAQAKQGVWQTNPDGVSVSLLAPRPVSAGGGMAHVIGADGRPITMRYDNLYKQANAAAASAPTNTSLLGAVQ